MRNISIRERNIPHREHPPEMDDESDARWPVTHLHSGIGVRMRPHDSIPTAAGDPSYGIHRGATAPDSRRRFILRIYVAVLVASLPLTVILLIGLHISDSVMTLHEDMMGLAATSVGIIGVLLFYIFLYKLEILESWTTRQRVFGLGFHFLSIFFLFFIVIWLGIASKWSATCFWGSYDLQTTSRSWVITVIVVGTITLLGSFFDLLRRYTFSRMSDGNANEIERLHEGNSETRTSGSKDLDQ